MHTRLLRALIAPLLLVASLVGLQLTTAIPAQAYATTTTMPWPSGLTINSATGVQIATHGDGSVTVGTTYCDTNNKPTEVTVSADHAQSSTITTGAGPGYNCPTQVVAGIDQTMYYLSSNSSTGVKKIVARSGNTLVWTYTIPSSCTSVTGLSLGSDGNLYFLERKGCNGTYSYYIASASSATGEVRFETAITGYVDNYTGQQVLPYDDGVAVISHDSKIYYFGYNGSAVSTFTPSAPSGAYPTDADVATDGRAYINTIYYDATTNHDIHAVYYYDLASATTGTVNFPAGASPGGGGAFHATPSDGLAMAWSLSGSRYFGYFDNTGTLVYSQVINAVTWGSELNVDQNGNVLLQREFTLTNNDQDVVLESYSPTGVKTTLFDATQQFGTSGLDVFSLISYDTPHVLGGGQYYMALCHRTSYPNYAPNPTCSTSTDNPQLVSIAVPGSDYPRSAVFDALGSQSSYVALGDSYSAGEGNPPFMEGTDNNGGDGCDRSLSGWPVTLAPDKNLRLSGFRACSGATTADVTSTFNGEPAQTDSLSSSTQVVTITIGGNDALFSDFAKACVAIGESCDSTSTQYAQSTDMIDNHLPSRLDTLFATIANDAPNAQVYVVGYPRVAPLVAGGCSFFSQDEEEAANDVTEGLNNDLAVAVGDANYSNGNTNFTFVDPTASGSPFIGHELCTSDPYFFGVNIAEQRFSFHPNPEGMDAYQILMAYALAS